MDKRMLSIGKDAKTVKGQTRGYLTGILYLAPYTVAGVGNFCPDSTPGCRDGCLFTAGRGVMAPVMAGRIKKTLRFKNDRPMFLQDVGTSIVGLVRKAEREGMTPLVRLNGTSDIPWENIRVNLAGQNFMEAFPSVQFYDYTKSPARMRAFLAGKLPKNYHLTFSRSECNDAVAARILADGGNVAVVFDTPKGQPLPAKHCLAGTLGYFPVIDGDTDDVRTEDSRGVIIGLRAKGKARKDSTGFVVRKG